MGKIDVYRILTQKKGICPPDSFFACSIYFRFQKPVDSDIDKKKEVCVDFSRMRLYGENTTLSISDGSNKYYSKFVSCLSCCSCMLETYTCTLSQTQISIHKHA